MSDKSERAERLARALRDNLHRRKAQAREQAEPRPSAGSPAAPASESET